VTKLRHFLAMSTEAFAGVLLAAVIGLGIISAIVYGLARLAWAVFKEA
jgi:hypothetical protein